MDTNNRYSVLLVDDEEDVIQIIVKKLDWEAMGLKIIGHAANGVEALELAEELQPDIVMTDIKMPYMDGLTLCRKLKELSRTIRVMNLNMQKKQSRWTQQSICSSLSMPVN